MIYGRCVIDIVTTATALVVVVIIVVVVSNDVVVVVVITVVIAVVVEVLQNLLHVHVHVRSHDIVAYRAGVDELLVSKHIAPCSV